MRIPKPWVPILAKKVAVNLTGRKLLEPSLPMDKFIARVEEIITEELMIEDRLNDEVRELLKKHASDIEKGKMDFRKLFELTKQKLVKERNLVL
ncbi:MAG: DUF507 family protein [Nitrospirae bacterium]|nr:DUF507 family protein [Nitrospirota bacterium]